MMRAKPPKPPDYIKLKAKEMPFWWAIVRLRDYSGWNEADLAHAANLARCKAHIEKLQKQIAKEPDTMMNAAGSPIINPKHKLIQDLTRQSIALSRLIHVHAEATVGRAGDQVKRNQKQRELQKNIQNADSLIAKPLLKSW